MTEKQAYAKVVWLRKALGPQTPFAVLRHSTRLDAKGRGIFAVCADWPAHQELVASLLADGFERVATIPPTV